MTKNTPPLALVDYTNGLLFGLGLPSVFGVVFTFIAWYSWFTGQQSSAEEKNCPLVKNFSDTIYLAGIVNLSLIVSGVVYFVLSMALGGAAALFTALI